MSSHSDGRLRPVEQRSAESAGARLERDRSSGMKQCGDEQGTNLSYRWTGRSDTRINSLSPFSGARWTAGYSAKSRTCSSRRRRSVPLSNASPDATDTPSELDVSLHYCYPLGMNCAEVGVLKQMHQVGFRRFLQCLDGRALPPESDRIGARRIVRFDELIGYLTHEARKGRLGDQQVGRTLVLADLAQGDRPWLIPPLSLGRAWLIDFCLAYMVPTLPCRHRIGRVCALP